MNTQFFQVYEKTCHWIENALIDREYTQSEMWNMLKTQTKKALEDIESVTQFEQILAHMVAKLPLSHCVFITPEAKAAQTHQTEDIPDILKPVSAMDSHYLYFKMPSLTLPVFNEEIFFDFLRPFKNDSRPLILDLRLNQGGSLSLTGHILGVLLGPNQPFSLSVQAGGKTQTVSDTHPFDSSKNQGSQLDIQATETHPHLRWLTPEKPPFEFKGPILVLSSGQNYSCGELFVQALKEHQRATVVGKQSAGAVLGAKDDFDCGQGYNICLPFIELLSVKGISLEKKGVSVDWETSFTEPDTTPLGRASIETILKEANKKGLFKLESQ